MKDTLFGSLFTTYPTVVVAEIGINHNGSLDTALAMVESASRAGADAVKFQSITPESLYSVYSSSYISGEKLSEDRTLLDFFAKFQLTTAEYQQIKERAEELGLVFFSTPFDVETVDMLDEIGTRLYKIASCDVTHHALLTHIAAKGKPVILSTGMSTLDEIDGAVEIFKAHDLEFALLYCVSLYPAEKEVLNLKRIETLKERYRSIVGFSDHSKNIQACNGALFSGARIIERHFTDSYERDVPDLAVSFDEADFAALVRSVREIEIMLGSSSWNITAQEEEIKRLSRRSLYTRRALAAGQVLTSDDIAFKRPNAGISAESYRECLGKKLRVPLDKDTLIQPDNLE